MCLVIGGFIFLLPDWAVATVLLLSALLPWFSLLRYMVMQKLGGTLLMALQQNSEKWSTSIMSGVTSILFGLPFFINGSRITSLPKVYSLSILIVSLGIFNIVKRIRHTQIRENGILYEFGSFYKWENIEGYAWKFGDDKLSLKLRKAIFKKNVNLKILSQFRQEVVVHLSQNVRVEDISSKGYVPVHKAG